MMDTEKEDLLLLQLDEFVSENEEIITNSVICEKLGLNLIESKYLLKKYVSEMSSTGRYAVTFLISGTLKTGEYSIQIVDSIGLFERKKLFSDVTNEVVYSIQINNCVDFNALTLVEKTKVSENFVPKGSIVGDKCTERVFQTKELPPPPPQKNFEKSKASSFFKPVAKPENGEKKESKSTSTNSSVNQPKKKGSLVGFLSQSNNNGNKQQLAQTSSEEDVRETKRPRMEPLESNDDEKIKEEVRKESDIEVAEIKAGSSKTVETKKEKKGNDEKKQDGKKRKRIILQSDSEDDIFGNDEEEKMDVDVEEEKPVIVQPKPVVPKNKRRQAVEKVYTDEDGYVVTRTEYVLVSASEDEEEVKEDKSKKADKPADKPEKKSPPQKPAAKNKKGKALASNQPTLMNFFKKK